MLGLFPLRLCCQQGMVQVGMFSSPHKKSFPLSLGCAKPFITGVRGAWLECLIYGKCGHVMHRCLWVCKSAFTGRVREHPRATHMWQQPWWFCTHEVISSRPLPQPFGQNLTIHPGSVPLPALQKSSRCSHYPHWLPLLILLLALKISWCNKFLGLIVRYVANIQSKQFAQWAKIHLHEVFIEQLWITYKF